MRFLESAMLYRLLLVASRPILGSDATLKRFIFDDLPMIRAGILPSLRGESRKTHSCLSEEPGSSARPLEVQREVLSAGQDLVVIRALFIADGLERPGDVIGGNEGVPSGDHAQILHQGQVEASYHPDDRLGLVDAPADKEAGRVGGRPLAPSNPLRGVW